MTINLAGRKDKVLSFKDKLSSKEDKEMSSVISIQNEFQEAFPKRDHGSVKAAIYAAYRFMKPRVEPKTEREFTLRRARSLHEGKCRRVDEAEREAIKAAKAMREAEQERTQDRAEYKYLRERIARLEAALALQGAPHPGAAVGSVQQSAGERGSVHRARAGE